MFTRKERIPRKIWAGFCRITVSRSTALNRTPAQAFSPRSNKWRQMLSVNPQTKQKPATQKKSQSLTVPESRATLREIRSSILHCPSLPAKVIRRRSAQSFEANLDVRYPESALRIHDHFQAKFGQKLFLDAEI